MTGKKEKKERNMEEEDDSVANFSLGALFKPSCSNSSIAVNPEVGTRKENHSSEKDVEHRIPIKISTSRSNRLEKLHAILCNDGRPRFRLFMENKVATGIKSNPFVEEPVKESTLRKHLRRYIQYFVTKALRKMGSDQIELSSKSIASFEFIENLNRELMNSISIVAGFSSQHLRVAKDNCMKFVVDKKRAVKMYQSFDFDLLICMVPNCPDKAGDFFCLEGGKYSEKYEVPKRSKKKDQEILFFCFAHHPLFEIFHILFHMKWNVFNNCLHWLIKARAETEDKTSPIEIPVEVQNSLILHYMSIYNLFWVFGSVDDWAEKDFNLFEVFHFRERTDKSSKTV